MISLIFQAKLEELQVEKQRVVSQKEAADDDNRKLVSECFLVHTFWLLKVIHVMSTYVDVFTRRGGC